MPEKFEIVLQERATSPENHYLQILQDRNTLLDTITPAFQSTGAILVSKFNDPLLMNPDSPHELPRGTTGEVFKELLENPSCAEVRKMWMDYPDALPEETTERFFGYLFNKLKQTKDGKIALRTRSSGESPIPYVEHTSAEVPFLLKAIKLGKKQVTILISGAHDLFEEGKRREGDILVGVTPQQFLNSFSDYPELAKQIALSALTLTETTYEQLPTFLAEPIQQFEGSPAMKKMITEARTCFPTDVDVKTEERISNRILKHLKKDPLEYGELALKIPKMVDLLLKASTQAGPEKKEELVQLAISIMEVEFGDRDSDIATLERIVTQRDPRIDTPTYTRYRVLLYASRMLNMFEKLFLTIHSYPHSQLPAHFSEAIKAYPELLRIKLETINEEMKKRSTEYVGAQPISWLDLVSFYKDTFHPLQEAADSVLINKHMGQDGTEQSPFIDQEITNILNTVGYSLKS